MRGDAISPGGSKLVHFWFIFPDRRIKVPNSCELGPLAGDVHDNGNADNTDTCVEGCKSASCGDGFVGPGEACDDANQDDADECGNNSSSPATAPTRQLTSKLHGRNRWVFPRPASRPPSASPRPCPPGLEKSWRSAGGRPALFFVAEGRAPGV